jgi:hypothetical protein
MINTYAAPPVLVFCAAYAIFFYIAFGLLAVATIAVGISKRQKMIGAGILNAVALSFSILVLLFLMAYADTVVVSDRILYEIFYDGILGYFCISLIVSLAVFISFYPLKK